MEKNSIIQTCPSETRKVMKIPIGATVARVEIFPGVFGTFGRGEYIIDIPEHHCVIEVIVYMG